MKKKVHSHTVMLTIILNRIKNYCLSCKVNFVHTMKSNSSTNRNSSAEANKLSSFNYLYVCLN